jgi:hypothetical protein
MMLSTIKDPSLPEPAKPILASQLLELEKKHRKRFTKQGRDERISTECGEIDEILGGGFERGIVVGISAEGGEGRLVGAFSKLSYCRKSSEGCWRQKRSSDSRLLSEWTNGYSIPSPRILFTYFTLPLTSLIALSFLHRISHVCVSILIHKFQISLHLLSSILLSNLTRSPTPSTKPKATIIDTTGSFPIALLAKVLSSRIISSRAASTTAAVHTGNYAVSGEIPDVSKEKVEMDVQRCLEMVAISRVFDFEGLWEVLGEVNRDSTLHDDYAIPSSPDPEAYEPEPHHPPEILDSEEELTPERASPPRDKNSPDPGIEIIIVDNLTHIITSLLAQKEKSEAHGLFALLSHTLHTMTHTSNILTILHNSTVPSKPTSTSTSTSTSSSKYNCKYPTTTGARTHHQHSRAQTQQIQNPTSIFLSNTAKPALGQIFTQFPDLHLFLSRLPKRREDAEMLYGRDEDSLLGYRNRKDVKYCYVVEVLKDETPNLGEEEEGGDGGESEGEGKEGENGKGGGNRFGWREQRWTAVDVKGDGTGFVGAFQVKGNMRGLGLDRERFGGLTDVGHVAKMYGFGGRRV